MGDESPAASAFQALDSRAVARPTPVTMPTVLIVTMTMPAIGSTSAPRAKAQIARPKLPALPCIEVRTMAADRERFTPKTRPAPAAGLGLESDKFSKEALETHFEAYFDPLLKAIGSRPPTASCSFT